jgi:hypothetical protein
MLSILSIHLLPTYAIFRPMQLEPRMPAHRGFRGDIVLPLSPASSLPGVPGPYFANSARTMLIRSSTLEARSISTLTNPSRSTVVIMYAL